MFGCSPSDCPALTGSVAQWPQQHLHSWGEDMSFCLLIQVKLSLSPQEALSALSALRGGRDDMKMLTDGSAPGLSLFFETGVLVRPCAWNPDPVGECAVCLFPASCDCGSPSLISRVSWPRCCSPQTSSQGICCCLATGWLTSLLPPTCCSSLALPGQSDWLLHSLFIKMANNQYHSCLG